MSPESKQRDTMWFNGTERLVSSIEPLGTHMAYKYRPAKLPSSLQCATCSMKLSVPMGMTGSALCSECAWLDANADSLLPVFNRAIDIRVRA